jgi:uncharacterized protein YlzI (FlbEa/FlbD family)
MIIKLTDYETGKPVYINKAAIAFMQTCEPGTIIYFINEAGFTVSETVKQILTAPAAVADV